MTKYSEKIRAACYVFLAFLIIVNFKGYAQKKDPDEILRRVKEKFSEIHDYSVKIHIKVDVDFIKMPETDATFYFKQPDKIHIESEKFTLLPKQGLNFSPLGFFNEKHTALYVNEDTVRGINTTVIKVIPLNSESKIVLSTLWIDKKRDVILKAEYTTKPSGTYVIDFYYNKNSQKLILPDSLLFSFTIDRLNLPKGMNGNLDSGTKVKKGRSKGKVYIKYSDYKINQNLPDSLFIKK